MLYEAPAVFAVRLFGESFLCDSASGTENVGIVTGLTDDDFE